MRILHRLGSGLSEAWLDHLTETGAGARPLERARRKSFVIARLAAACGALFAAPFWLFLQGAPNLQQLALFGLAQAPLLSVVLLARIGDLRLSQTVSALGVATLALALEIAAPAQGQVAAALLAVALVEAALTQQQAVLAAVGGVAGAALAVAAFAGDAQSATTEAVVAVAALLAYLPLLTHGAVRAEQARARADQRNARDLRLVTGALGDIVLNLDRTGAVSALLGEVHKTYGMEERDLLGRGFFQRVHVADRPAFLKLVCDAAETGGPLDALLRIQTGATRNPATRVLEPVFGAFDARACRVSATVDSDDAAAPQIVCILRDVTLERRAEEEIASARLQGELANAAKTRFLANISHELRTPLSAIIGFSDILASETLEPADPAKRREYARIIGESGQHLLEMVNAILDMSKIESGAMQLAPEPFSLPDLADQCCAMMQLKADQNGVALARDYARGLDEIVADRRACKQILINLLSNAVKFTPAPGRVEVDIRPEGNTLAVSVIDTGIGIAPADLDRLGDPFFQASAAHDRAYEGTGLGLSLVRGLVALHGGSITIESAPQAGTRVTVRLPLDCRNHSEKTPAGVKIETIVRHGVYRAAPAQEREKKIA